MEAIDAGAEEVLLFNSDDELTEAACNVFVVWRYCPAGADHQIAWGDASSMPGATKSTYQLAVETGQYSKGEQLRDLAQFLHHRTCADRVARW